MSDVIDAYDGIMNDPSMINSEAGDTPTNQDVIDIMNIDILNEKQQEMKKLKLRAKVDEKLPNGFTLQQAAIERTNLTNRINLYRRLIEYNIIEVDKKNKWIYYLKKICYLLLFTVFILIFKDMFGDLSKYDN